ncbi:hypothetical protein EMIT0158MI4_30283 [Burkholderia ambifaria]
MRLPQMLKALGTLQRAPPQSGRHPT